MSVLVHAQSIKTVHAGAGAKKWQNIVHVVVGWINTVKDLITIQHKIIILGVTTAYYLSFLDF